MEVLSSRVLLYPADFEQAERFYADTLGLHVYREYGAEGRITGVVFFLGGGFLELASAGGVGPAHRIRLWLQVADVDAEHERLQKAGARIAAPPADKPWGLREMDVLDPEGTCLRLVEVPEDHPLRRRLS